MEFNDIGKIIKDFEKALKNWESAIKKKDCEVADIMQKRANDIYKQYKDECKYADDTENANAGELGSMFESALPTLFVKNKKAVGDVLRLIKEDANVKSQLQFFETMKNYDGSSDAKEYINESVNLAANGINLQTLKESNKNFGRLLVSHNVRPEDEIDEDKEAFFKAGTYLLTHKKKLNNLSEISKNRNIVEKYICEHKKNINEDKINLKKLTEDFDKKMSMLNEDERALVNDIINSQSSVAEARQRKFFNSLKEKCMSKIDSLISESNEDDKLGLQSIKEEISKMEYCKESIIKDTAKLLEVGSVLSDK